MANDMFSKLNELLQNAESIQLKQEDQEAAERRKKKVRRKKKKKQPGSADKEAGISSPERASSPDRQRGHLEATTFGILSHYTPGQAFQSPSALKAAYQHQHPQQRPYSAAVGTRRSLGGGRPLSAAPAHLRPASALPGSLSAAAGGGLAGGRPQASQGPPGPSAKALADAKWRDVSPPKYTATSLKEPELGTVPGKYQSPPWKPLTADEKDPQRQEIPFEIKEARFKHVLAVPAHVLAQSLYHPNCPSDRTRAKQLAEDLKAARADRFVAIRERQRVEAELGEAHDQLHHLDNAVHALRAENHSLQEQLASLLKAHKALQFERDQLEEQLVRLRGRQSSGGGGADD